MPTKKEENQQNIIIIKMQNDINGIKEKIGLVPTRDEMKLAIKEGVSEALKESDKKYSSKWVESAFKLLITTIALSVLYAILKQVGL